MASDNATLPHWLNWLFSASGSPGTARAIGLPAGSQAGRADDARPQSDGRRQRWLALPRLEAERLDAMPRAAGPERGQSGAPPAALEPPDGGAGPGDHGARAEAYAAAAAQRIDAALGEAQQLRCELEGVIGSFGRSPGLPPAALQGRPSK